MSFIHDMREGGMYAIETYMPVTQKDLYSRFEPTNCTVVYADRDRPSHSTRIFMYDETAVRL